jgi:MscS family membrane protein
MKAWLRAFRDLDPELQLLAQVGTILVLALVVDFVLRRLLRRFAARAATTSNLWDDALVHATGRPALFLLWLSAALGALALARRHLELDWLGGLGQLWSLTLIGLLTWFLLRLTRAVERGVLAERAARGTELDRTTVDAVGKLVRVVVGVLAALAVLQTVGVGIAGILAAGGVGGIAVGFAAKDLLANFFGGLTVYLDRPFAVGDWIRTLDDQIEGVVEHIGWRSTVVRTFDKRPIYVPNALFTTIAVENPSRMSHRRIKEWVGVRYQDAARLPAVLGAVRSALQALPDVAKDQDLLVHLDRFGPSSVDLLIECYTEKRWAAEYRPVREAVLLTVHAAITSAGAEIAFPTQVVRVEAPEPGR